MDTKRIKGLQVITLAGVRAGTVDQIFFDPATKHIAGFVLQADPTLWDARLDELLKVPRRRDARIPVRLETWSRVSEDGDVVEGNAVNISVNGLLFELTEWALRPLRSLIPPAGMFDLSFMVLTFGLIILRQAVCP